MCKIKEYTEQFCLSLRIKLPVINLFYTVKATKFDR